MKNTGFFTKKCAFIILLLGIILGIIIIILGFFDFRIVNNNLNNDEYISEKRTKENIQNDIFNVEEQINNIRSEIKTLEKEKNNIFLQESFSENYYSKNNEIQNKRNELSNLNVKLNKYEDELFFIDDDFYYERNIFDNKFIDSLNLSFQNKMLIFGGYIILFAIFSYICIMLGYRRRNYIINNIN